MNKPMRCMVVAVLIAMAVPILAKGGRAMFDGPASVTEGDGLKTVTWESAKGKISLRIPQDATSDASFTGTVVAEGNGKTEKERKRNTDELNGQVVDINGAKTKVGDKLVKVVGAAGAAALVAMLVNKGGHRTAPVSVESEVPYVPLPRPERPEPGDFSLPRFGTTNRPVAISGPFDGDMGFTNAKFNGAPLEEIAESNGIAVFEPPDAAGSGTLTMTKGDVTVEGPYNNIAVLLDATKTTLRPGETARMSATVSGLKDLDQEVPLELNCTTPRVASMEGGLNQTILIKPGMATGEGVYVATRTLTGVTEGMFNVKAKLHWPWTPRLVTWRDVKSDLDSDELKLFIDAMLEWVENELKKPKMNENRRSVLESLRTALKDAQGQYATDPNPDSAKVRDIKDLLDLYLVKVDVTDLIVPLTEGLVDVAKGTFSGKPSKAAKAAIKYILKAAIKIAKDGKRKEKMKQHLKELEELEKQAAEAEQNGDTDKKAELDKKIDEKEKEIQKDLKPAKYY